MCGIIGTAVKNPETVKAEIMLIFEAQKHRGTEGFGIAVRKKNKLLRERTTTLDQIVKSPIWKEIKRNDVVIFHHRQPTSTPNVEICNHPFLNEDCSIALAHNGIVSRAQKELDTLSKSHVFESLILPEKVQVDEKFYYHVTDSEIPLHMLEEWRRRLSIEEALKRLQRLYTGTFFIIFKSEPCLFFTTNSSDLAIYNSVSGNTFLTSEVGTDVTADVVGFLDREGRVKFVHQKHKTTIYFNTKRMEKDIYDVFYGADFYDDPFNIIKGWEEHKNAICGGKLCAKCLLLNECIDIFLTSYPTTTLGIENDVKTNDGVD